MRDCHVEADWGEKTAYCGCHHFLWDPKPFTIGVIKLNTKHSSTPSLSVSVLEGKPFQRPPSCFSCIELCPLMDNVEVSSVVIILKEGWSLHV